MIKQVGRMPPELSSRLQYKDYTTTETDTFRQVLSKQSERRRHKDLPSRLDTAATGIRARTRGLSIEEKDLEASLLMRNSFVPITVTKDVGPTTSFKVPDIIAQALKDRDRPDIYLDIVIANKTSSRSPAIRHEEYDPHVDPEVLMSEIREASNTRESARPNL
jgi:hypothetical protein